MSEETGSAESLEQIVEKICKHSGFDKDKVLKLIEDKQDELSGLVSKEGAAYIVGRELGISLLKEAKRQLKIKNLVSGLQSVDIVAKVVKVSGVTEFERAGKKGKVMNMLLGDETGLVRMTFWNDEVDKALKSGMKEGDCIKVYKGFVKVDNRENLELRLGKGKMEKGDKSELPQVADFNKFTVPARKTIPEFKEGEFEEVRASIVQLFKRNPFYEVCPQCGVRLKSEGDKLACTEHGVVEPQYQLVVSGIIDDGHGNIRAVIFRETAEKLFGKTAAELHAAATKAMNVEVVFEHFDGLGKDFIFRGRVKKSEFTGNLEFIVNEIAEPDIKKECADLLGKLNA